MIASPETVGKGGVMVVDDDPALLTTLRDILAIKGYQVTTEQKGLSALERIIDARDAPLVALVDVGLPDLSGLELARRISEHNSTTQVIILTGDATLESAIAAVQTSTVDYLVKPVEPTRLFATIGRAFERALRKVAESALEAERQRKSEILEASPIGLLMCGSDGRIEYVNEVGGELLELAPTDVVSGQIAERVRRWLSSARSATGVDDHEVDVPFAGSRGERIFSCRERRLRGTGGDGGDGGSVLLAFTDVTASRRVEEALQQTQKLEAVGRLAGGVAHDFNNLLTVILAHAELAAADLDTESSVLADLQAIRDAAEQASDVVGQLLRFSRRDPGRVEAMDLNDVVRGGESLLARTIGQGISIVVELDPGLPPVVADVGWIRQVIMNLAMNARDAMPDGGVLTFRTGRGGVVDGDDRGGSGHEGGDWVYFEVEDTGFGMDEDTKARVFEPFFTTKVEGKGTGLGLATVYGIVSQLGAPSRSTPPSGAAPASA